MTDNALRSLNFVEKGSIPQNHNFIGAILVKLKTLEFNPFEQSEKDFVLYP